MTTTESDLVTSLENRVRALEKCKRDLSETVLNQFAQIEFLMAVVDLLSLPRHTEADIAGVFQGLQALQRQHGERVM